MLQLYHSNGRTRERLWRPNLRRVGALLAGGALWWGWNRLKHGAPGWPGGMPHWNFSSKDGVGTSLARGGEPGSRVWFTIRHGALTEVFYPRVDQPAVRDWRLIVTDDHGFYSDEVDDASHEIEWLAAGVPGFELRNTCRHDRYRIEKSVFSHPRRDAILQYTRFDGERFGPRALRLFTFLNPHLKNRGQHNTARIGLYKGTSVLLAERAGYFLAVACTIPWRSASAGYVDSVSDARRDLKNVGRLQRRFERASDGNVALVAEVDLATSDGSFLMALGFGTTADEAALVARATLRDDFEVLRQEFIDNWQQWQSSLRAPARGAPARRDLYRVSTAMLRTHQDRTALGAAVASLSTPWGEARTDSREGRTGYHVVWPRDLSQIAGGLLAAGANVDALRALEYLLATQDSDGHWPQNQWVDGARDWTSIQMCETALPILLLEQSQRAGVISSDGLKRYWPMVRSALGYIVREGPSTLEDRWENARGFTPFTLSVLIAAAVVASDMADLCGEPAIGNFLRETADAWNERIERWTYVEGTALARTIGVEGYYLRIAPPDCHGLPLKYNGRAELWYRPSDMSGLSPAEIVSPDALAYVRYGLRAADDPRIQNTVKVIDALLRVETPRGPAWHRYNHDGYGEKWDGAPFDYERGIGRAWPLLTGERGHYELAAGRKSEAEGLLGTMAAFASDSGMLPEQVWDGADVPGRNLYFGRPTGSAMPLAWAHAEYLKLRRSIEDGRVFDMPPQTKKRYLDDRVKSRLVIWRPSHGETIIPSGKDVRVEVFEPGIVRWCSQERGPGEIATRDTGLGLHTADLPTAGLPPFSKITIAFKVVPSSSRAGCEVLPA